MQGVLTDNEVRVERSCSNGNGKACVDRVAKVRLMIVR